MKISEFAERVEELAKRYPDAEVVFCSEDDEGVEHFKPVENLPSVGFFDNGEFRQFGNQTANSICIN